MKTRTLIIAATAVALASCVTVQTAQQQADVASGRIVAQVCKTFPGISYDGVLDTKLTKEQIKQYNARRSAICKATEITK